MRGSSFGCIAWLASFAVFPAYSLPAAEAAELPLLNEALVEGSVDEIWPMITTKEGMESWMVAHAEVDLRAGGLLRTNHDPKGKIGDAQTVTNRIKTVTPKRLLSFEVTKAPAQFPFAGPVVGTWYEVTLIPLSPRKTRVRCVGRGFEGGPLGYPMRVFFERGSGWALEQLQKAVADRRARRRS
ncbi:MAG: SRPBCC family protein [Vicinamibacteria bacterium]